jgi:GT2 family glycosyltransferase
MPNQARVRVRVIVLNFNGGEMVLRAIASVLDSRWPADAIEVVLVDNASTDGSADRVASQFPAVRVIRSARNAGFPANNLAMADLTGIDFVALVNPDAFVEPDWLSPLVDALREDEHIGAACPLMLFVARDDDGREVVNNAGCEMLTNGYARDRSMGVARVLGDFVPVDVFAWSGGAVLLRREYLDDVGLFDARYFLYFQTCTSCRARSAVRRSATSRRCGIAFSSNRRTITR